MSGGSLSMSMLTVGSNAAGSFAQSGGTNTVSSYFYVGQTSGVTGKLLAEGSARASFRRHRNTSAPRARERSRKQAVPTALRESMELGQ